MRGSPMTYSSYDVVDARNTSTIADLREGAARLLEDRRKALKRVAAFLSAAQTVGGNLDRLEDCGVDLVLVIVLSKAGDNAAEYAQGGGVSTLITALWNLWSVFDWLVL